MHIDKAKEIIAKLSLPDFSLEDIRNPNLEKFYGVLEALALEKDFNDSDIHDETLPDLSGIQKRASSLIEKLKEGSLVNAQPESAATTLQIPTKRLPISKSAEKSKTIVEDPMEAIEKCAAKEEDLNIFKMADLKRYLEKRLNISTSVRLKAQVIDKILVGNEQPRKKKLVKGQKGILESESEGGI